MKIVDVLNKLQHSANEKFAVFYHTSKGIYSEILAEGCDERVLFSAKDVIETAQRRGATMVSIAHNHPSGPVRPSAKDLSATFTLQDKLKANGVELHDHVIVGQEGTPFSMLANGVI